MSMKAFEDVKKSYQDIETLDQTYRDNTIVIEIPDTAIN
jgi:hypothetical protein